VQDVKAEKNCMQKIVYSYGLFKGAIFDSAHILLALCISELIRMMRAK
jgi:hypothetical protein